MICLAAPSTLIINSVFHPVKNNPETRQLRVDPIYDSVVLRFQSPPHWLLCAVFSLKDYYYAPQCAQIAIQVAFYRLQLAFSL